MSRPANFRALHRRTQATGDCAHGRVSHGRVPHRRVPHGLISHRRVLMDVYMFPNPKMFGGNPPDPSPYKRSLLRAAPGSAL